MKSAVKRASKYFWIFKLDFKQRIYYLADYLLSALFIAVVLIVFINLWKTIFAGRPTISGFTFVQMIWYLALTEAITMGSGWRMMFEDVTDDIRTGTVSNFLTKPLSYMGWYFSTTFSRFFNAFLVTFILGSIFCYIFVGPIPFSFMTILPLALVIICSFFLSFFVGMFFVSFAFWLEDVTAFYWILQKALFILGGMLVPIDVYPDFVSKYLYYLPFSFITYWPAKFFVSGDVGTFILVLTGQIIWLALFFVLTMIIYRIGIRRINIYGG